MRDHPLWNIFRKQKKGNTLFFFGLLFFNSAAALLEGASFGSLLGALSSLTGEETLSVPLVSQLHSLLPHFNPFAIFLSGAILLQLLKSVATYMGQMINTHLILNIQTGAQAAIFKQIYHSPYSTIAHLKKGELTHCATAPPSFIPLLFDEYNRFVISLLMVAAYLIFMSLLSPGLTLGVLIFFTLATVAQKWFLNKITRASGHHTEAINDLSSYTAQNMEGLKAIHLYHRQEEVLNNSLSILKKITRETLNLRKWHAFIPAFNETLGVLLVGLTLIVSPLFMKKTGGELASYLFIYLTLTYRLGTRLHTLMAAKGGIAYHSGPLLQLGQFLKIPPNNGHTATTPAPPFSREIQFDRVSFCYPSQKKPILKNISLSIPQKKIVALVGLSGAGKSSIIDLLLRLYAPSAGTIRLDGQPIDTFSLMSWRHLFGVVPQEPFLFNDTVANNIKFGNLDASHNDMIEAAQHAGAHEFISTLPLDYETVIGEKGYRLSGGERQRIALAQALLKNPQILILDEATSHLDSYSESLVQATLHHLKTEKTLLIIAHRLSTIHMADHIFVVENGSIVEEGSHKDLVASGGRYTLFWQLQSKP